jgi:ABC-type transport system involved in multi-copper enzyme maturation permease subunit
LGALLSGLVKTAVRFTLPLGCALTWAAIAIGLEHGVDRGETKLAEQLQVLFLLGFFWTLAAKLFAERRGWPVLWHLPLAAAGLALLALRVFIGPQTWDPFSNPTVLLLGPGMVLLMMVAPLLSAKSDDAALWDFNRAGWVSAAFGLLVATIVGIGLSLAFAAVEVLLVELPNHVYADIWILCMSVIWPLQALSGVPRSFQRPEGDFCPRWLAFLISYLLVPLASLYLVILYLYMAKILVQWELPKGQVGFMVSGYGTFGVATHLLAHPLRVSGNRLVRLFHRHFYHALYAPILLLVVAVGVRISEYGITENRYALILFAVWLLAMALYFSLRARRRLVTVPLSLSLLLIAASFGPWGASGLSTISQMARLEQLLAANGILAEGRMIPAERSTDREQTRRISALVDYFSNSGKLDALRDRLAEDGVQFEHDTDKFEIMAALGLEYIVQRNESFYFAYRAASGHAVDVSDFEVLSSLTLSSTVSLELAVEGITRTYEVAFDREAGTLAVRDATGERVLFDLGALAKRLRQEPDSRNEISRKLMTLEGSSDKLRVRILFETLNGGIENGVPRVTYIDAVILIGRR